MEDYFTSSVDGARGFAQANCQADNDMPSNRELANEAAAEAYKAKYGREWWEENDDEDEEDNCNCSDPGCPCGGRKSGGY